LRVIAEKTKCFIELGLLALAFDADDQPDAVIVGQLAGDDVLTAFEESLEESVGQAVVLKTTQRNL
jgi:hypothetical protein